MKISKIEFENFRNFKDHGEVRCSTDGKVTIIYGRNGDGKTTLHQLFQWVFYGKVHFNKTTTDRLYNHQYESEAALGEEFPVLGCIDFEHEGKNYSVRRVYTYKKGLQESVKVAEDFSVSVEDEDHNWRRVDNPRDVIEKLIPSGLSDYFFFDGESMIADLRVKGRDSADKLKSALYSMFDLDVIEAALNDIGRDDLKTTALGKLFLSKGTIASDSETKALKTDIEGIQTQIGRQKAALEKDTARKAELQQVIQSVSEQIGKHKSKAEYEAERRKLKRQRDVFLGNADESKKQFGDAVMDMFPPLLISKSVDDAKNKINLRIAQNKLPAGLQKRLLHYLLSRSTTECICGRPLGEDERKHLEGFLDMLPPKSYTNLYNEFIQTAKLWGKGYDKGIIDAKILAVSDNNAEAAACDRAIRELDEEEKKSTDIEDLIVQRQEAEQEIAAIDRRIADNSTLGKVLQARLKKKMGEFDEKTKQSQEGRIAQRRIDILKAVSDGFQSQLKTESLAFSQKLEINIQDLINRMLTSQRKVSVTPEFSVRITDSYNDESKSEGQFAVVSFAYIGGILKMLQSEGSLQQKEYPLVLDGPFSKLDPIQRQNVVDELPQFAPQVILFSKDDLQEVFSKESIGSVWTIQSNEEKNVAHVEEGFLWN